MEKPQKPRKFGIAGTFIGLVALGIAVLHFFAGPIETPPPIEETVAQLTVNIKDAMSAKFKGEEYVAPAKESGIGPDKIVEYSVIAFGFLALVLGVVGFVRGEDIKANGAAVAVGAGAITFQFAVAVVGAILGIMLIAAIIGSIGGG